MSDMWPFSSSSPSPIIHHSSLSQSSPFLSSPPPLSSPSSPGNHGNLPHAKVPPCSRIPQTQVCSPHLPEPQVTSPHHLPSPQVTSLHLSHPQVTSPHLLYQPQETSPHCVTWSQATSPHCFPQAQLTSPHLPPPQVTSPHHNQPQINNPHLLPQTQVTSPHFPHPYVTSPHFVPQPQVTSPHFVAQPQINSPHLISLPQHHLANQNPDPCLDNPDWSRAEPPSDLSYLLKSDSYSYQNQTTAHLDHLHLQNQNQFSTGVTHHRDELENTHSLVATGVYEQGDPHGPLQDTWRPPRPTVSQLQCSPLGSMSGEVALGRWSSMEFSSSPAEDSSSTQFFHDSCHDNNAPQPFCSPNTPGPSPHYPQTPAISSPGPQMHPWEERLDFHTQTSRQLSRDKTLCLHEYDSYPMISNRHHPHQTGRHLLQSQSELIQEQTGLLDANGNAESCFPPQRKGQDVSSSAQSPGHPAGLSWRDECGGGGGGGGGRRRGGGRGGRGGGNGQPDWTRVKRPQLKNSTEAADCRLLCMVCKRDFRSLPALNGHMRSHSGSRPAGWLTKVEDPSPLVPTSISMVMPVTVPVQSRGTAKTCRSGQKRCGRLSSAAGHAVLYRSLLHLEEEEVVAKGDGVVSSGGDEEEAVAEDGKPAVSGDGVVTGVKGVHYTPPPMLCPLRTGPGLYCSLTTRRQQRVQTVQLHNANNGLNDLVAMETASPPPGTLTGINKPRINVGRDFQAEVPPLQGRKHAHSDSHNALLVWTPWDGMECSVNKQRVEALLTMVRSSVMPGGGISLESALHILSDCRGDFLLTVEKLLSTPETSNNINHTAQQYPSGSWSAAEKKLLIKSLQLHQKDFSRIQEVVQTKSLSQCVEFYYLWKKKLSLSARPPAGLTVTLPDTNGQRSSKIS